jgi:hypothetical protein
LGFGGKNTGEDPDHPAEDGTSAEATPARAVAAAIFARPCVIWQNGN